MDHRYLYKPCGTKNHPEYWYVRWDSKGNVEDIMHHVRSRDNSNGYFFCTTQFSGVHHADLCRSCMVKYGLLW